MNAGVATRPAAVADVAAAPPRLEAPLVTVIAQCYNHERFLHECLTSIQQQSMQDFELIVVDDCSKDESVAHITAWVASHRPDSRVIALRNNLGVSGSLNTAVAAARGTYVTRIATDDVWEPTFLERTVAKFEALPDGYGAVYSDAWCMDESGHRLESAFIEAHRSDFTPPEGDILNALAAANFIPAAAILIRRDALLEVGPFDESLVYEDWDMWLRLAERFLVGFVPARLAHYRIVECSLARKLFVSGQAHRPDVRVTHGRMAAKLLRMTRLDPAVRTSWLHQLIEDGKFLYRAGDSRASEMLMAGARASRDVRVAAWALAARLGVPARPIDRVLARVRGLIRR